MHNDKYVIPVSIGGIPSPPRIPSSHPLMTYSNWLKIRLPISCRDNMFNRNMYYFNKPNPSYTLMWAEFEPKPLVPDQEVLPMKPTTLKKNIILSFIYISWVCCLTWLWKIWFPLVTNSKHTQELKNKNKI